MSIKNKNSYIKHYIIATILCIFAAIYLQVVFYHPHPSYSLSSFSNSKQLPSLFPRDNISYFIGEFVYLLILGTGVINFLIFIIHKVKGKHWIKIQAPVVNLEISNYNIVRLCFFIVYLYLAANLVFLLFNRILSLSNIHRYIIAIIGNMGMEIAMGLFVLRFIPLKFLGFYYTREYTSMILKLYTLLFSTISLVSIILFYISTKVKIIYTPNPAIYAIKLLHNNPVLLSILLIEIIILAPISEELIFRGFLYKWVRRYLPFHLSTILISSLFAILHGDLINFLFVFIISFYICYIYEKTQSIIAPIIFHSLHNTIFLLLFLALM